VHSRSDCFHCEVINFPNYVTAFKAFFRRANELLLHRNNRCHHGYYRSHVVTKFTITDAVWYLAYAFISCRTSSRLAFHSQTHSSSCAFRSKSRACIHIPGIYCTYMQHTIACVTLDAFSYHRVDEEMRNWSATMRNSAHREKKDKKTWVFSLKPTTTIHQINKANTRSKG